MQDVALQTQQFAAWLADTDIGLLELHTPHGSLRLGREGSQIVELLAAEANPELLPIKAPSLGIFVHGHPLAATTLVRTGQRVQEGQVIGLLQIGPLLLPVTAPQAGIVEAIHAPDATVVGYGTPLFDLYPL